MKKRGKILRDPRSGPGLLMVEGRQYWFSGEEVWRSEIPPRPALDVEVKFNHAGRIIAITALCELQVAAQRVQQPTPTIRAKTTRAKMTGARILRKIAAKCGMPNLLGR
jgi:hypothetical protein